MAAATEVTITISNTIMLEGEVRAALWTVEVVAREVEAAVATCSLHLAEVATNSTVIKTTSSSRTPAITIKTQRDLEGRALTATLILSSEKTTEEILATPWEILEI